MAKTIQQKMQDLFSSPEGAEVLDYILSRSGLFASDYALTNDSRIRKEGVRSFVYSVILKPIHFSKEYVQRRALQELNKQAEKADEENKVKEFQDPRFGGSELI